MAHSVVCALVGHRYTYEPTPTGERAGPRWVCRRCGDHQDTRPPPSGMFQWPFLGGPAG